MKSTSLLPNGPDGALLAYPKPLSIAMISFPHAISLLNQQGLLDPLPLEAVKQAPLFVSHHSDQEIKMPSRQEWQKYIALPEFPKVLPAPITKTIQTANSLRGYRVYSILMSDGDRLLAHKMLANDNLLLLMLQVHPIADTLQKACAEGQPLDLSCKCYTVYPEKKQVPETEPQIASLARTLCVSTMHFIYSIHLGKNRYQANR